MKILIETNAGLFAGYLTSAGEVILYEGDSESSVVTLPAMVKRRPVLDLSSEGVASVIRSWLENQYERLEIESITVHLFPPGN
jgi:hypothetical protein